MTHADGISATTPVNILPSGYVDFDVTQSGPRTLAVPALGAVIGKLGNLTYGAAGPNNISFVTNSVLGPDEGETNVPTQAQVGGARLLLGLTSNTQNVTVGGNIATADPADIYRGVAIGQWISAGNLSATLNSAGTQDLNIQIIPPGVSQNGNAVFKNIAPTTSFNSAYRRGEHGWTGANCRGIGRRRDRRQLDNVEPYGRSEFPRRQQRDL